MDMTLLFPILILLLFIPIFLSGRKQKRQVAEQQQMQNALSAGDVVTTTSGLRGTVVDTSYEDTIDLEIADGIVTTWLRAAVRDKVAVDHADDAEEPEIEAGGGTGAALPATTATSPVVNGGSNGTAGTNGSAATNGTGPADAVVEPAKDPAADDTK